MRYPLNLHVKGFKQHAGLAIFCAVIALLVGVAPAMAANPYVYDEAQSELLNSSLPGGFAQPWGMDFQANGDLLVSDVEGDGGEGILDEFGAEGIFQSQLGSAALSGKYTRGVAVSRSSGHIYVADSNHDEVFALSETGGELSVWNGAGGGGLPPGTLGGACCFVFDAVDNSSSVSAGDVYLQTTNTGGEVDVLKPREDDAKEAEFVRSLTVPGGFSFGFEGSIAVDPSSGRVYVADPGHRVVDRFSPTGELEESAQLTGPAVGEKFKQPAATAVDANGNLFVDDRQGGVQNGDAIYEFSPTGTLLNRIEESGPGEPLGSIRSLAVLQDGPHAGTLYAMDATRNAIDVFTPSEPEAPAIEGEAVTRVTGDSVSFGGEINPRGSETSYHYEYGLCSSPSTCASSPYEHELLQPEAALGASDFTAHATRVVQVQGLLAQSVYHYRVLAHNAFGQTIGQERVFTTQGPASTLQLPDGREWELVSPPEKHGGILTQPGLSLETGLIQAAADGSAIAYLANSPTEDSAEGNAAEVQVLSRRGTSGWSSRDIASPHRHVTGHSLSLAPEYRFFSEDLSSAIVQPWGLFESALSEEASEQTPYLRALGSCASDCYQPLVTGKPGHENVPAGTRFGEELPCEENIRSALVPSECGPLYLISTPDGSHVVLRSQAPLVAGAPENELYEWTGGRLQLISVLSPNEAGEELPAPSGPSVGEEPVPGSRFGGPFGNARRAISADGSSVVFESEEKLYLRDTARSQSVQLDAPEAGCPGSECKGGGGRFQIASSDGSRIFFTDERRLSRDSAAASESPDLYECRIALNSEGRLTCELHDLTPGAGVQGDLLGASEDGATLYFVADGILPGSGAEEAGSCSTVKLTQAPNAQCNLYELHEGQARLVAVLGGGDQNVWDSESAGLQQAQASPNGQWLAFLSERSLSGYDNRDEASGKPDAEAFVYDAGSGKLACASCDPSGGRPAGVEYGKLQHLESEALPAPRGGWDIGGWVAALLPHGDYIGGGQPAYQPRYLSNSGRLFFDSLDALVPQDVNGTGDVYEYEPAGVGSCGERSTLSTTGSLFEPPSDGCIALISSGVSSEASAFLDASQTGDDVVFMTASKLSEQDIDSAQDIYDAHVCSSESPCISHPVPPPPCTTEASCKAAPTPQPQVFGVPPSATFNGLGNPAPATPAQKATKKALTRPQKLAAALKACKKQAKGKRSGCEKAARKRFGPVKRAKAKPKKR
jgi:DNA-binding beta-propeller fold protein YncE